MMGMHVSRSMPRATNELSQKAADRAHALQRKGMTLSEIAALLCVPRAVIVAELYERPPVVLPSNGTERLQREIERLSL